MKWIFIVLGSLLALVVGAFFIFRRQVPSSPATGAAAAAATGAAPPKGPAMAPAGGTKTAQGLNATANLLSALGGAVGNVAGAYKSRSEGSPALAAPAYDGQGF